MVHYHACLLYTSVILDIKVNVGDTVKKGQVIIILEAMKMENNINADKDGKICLLYTSCFSVKSLITREYYHAS